MNRDQARNIIKNTSTQRLDTARCLTFTGQLLNMLDRPKMLACRGQYEKGVLSWTGRGVKGEGC